MMVRIKHTLTGLYLVKSDTLMKWDSEGSYFTKSQAHSIVNGKFSRNLKIVE